MVGSNMDLLLAAASADQVEMVGESCAEENENIGKETEWMGVQEGEETAEVLVLEDDEEPSNDDKGSCTKEHFGTATKVLPTKRGSRRLQERDQVLKLVRSILGPPPRQ